MRNNTSIILLFLAVGLFYTFTRDQYEGARSLHTLAGEYRAALDNVSRIEDLRNNLTVVYEALPETEIDRLNKVLPDDNNSVALALELDSIAARHGISLKNINAATDPASESQTVVMPDGSTSQSSGPGSYGKVTVTIDFVADYDRFVSFLTDLERNLRIMNIKSINFQTYNANLYDHKLILETYWLK